MDIRKTLAGASAALVAFSQIATGIAAAATFSDVSSDHWAYSYVEQLVEDGVVDSADNFRPNDQLNRAELVKIALVAAGIEIDTEDAPSFDDVAADAWFYPYVATAAKAGIVGGYTDASGEATGMFGPADVVTRAAATKILVNAYGIAFDLTPASTFADVADETAWFYPYVVTAYNQSILDGYSNGNFGPDDAVTRAQIAKIAVNAANPTERAVEDDDDDEDDTPAVVEMGDGELMIEISDDTPASATLPQGAEGVPAAAFDFTASNDDDVIITALQIFRSGLGNDTTLAGVALFDEDGNRISKAKTFSSSEDVANVTILNGGLEVRAGKTVTLYARVNVGAAAANNQFAIAIKSVEAVSSNAAEVDGDFPVVGETMEVGGVSAAALAVEGDGMPSDVKLGQSNAEIAKIKLKNNDNNANITISGITLKEEGTVSEDADLANFKFYLDGELVASTESISDKYLSFMFDEAVTIESSKTLKGYITADIIGGANKYINFQIDNDLDVLAVDEQYGYGPAVTATVFNTANAGTAAASRVAIDAGELAIVQIDAEKTDIRQDKKDTVLGTLKVTVNAGQDLELQKVKVQIDNTNAGKTANQHLDDILENVEIYDGSTVYDLSTETGVDSFSATYEDSDLSIILADGETYELQIRADIRNVDQAGPTDLDMTKVTLVPSISAIGNATKTAAGFYVEETDDDQAVTDITPSSITFKSLAGQESTTTINTIVQSATKNAVIGTTGVEVLEFEVKAGNASDLYIDRVTVKGTAVDNGVAGAGVTVDNTRVNKATLYLVDGADLVELDTQSGSQFSSSEVEFDGFREKVALNETARFLVTVDVINDINQALDTLNFELKAISVEDDDSDDITTGTVNGGAETLTGIIAGNAASARTVTIVGVGTLAASVDNTDNETNKAKWVLGNTTYKYVASYELTAQNEGVKIKDLEINEMSGSALKDAIAEVVLFDEAGEEIARKSVTSDTVSFTDIDYVVEEGSENIYVGVVARKLGKDQAGKIVDGLTLELTVSDAEGSDSGKAVDVTAIDATGDVAVTPSLAFGVIPTHISNVEFVDSASGAAVTNKLVAGTNTVAILKVTTEASSNTDNDTGASLKTLVQALRLNVDFTSSNGGAGTAPNITNMYVERVNGTGTNSVAGVDINGAANAYVDDGANGADGDNDSSTADVLFTLSGAGFGTNDEIDNGTTVYYAVKAALAGDFGDSQSATLKVGMYDLDDAADDWVLYSSNDTTATTGLEDVYDADGDGTADTPRDTMRISTARIESTQISK